MATPKYKARGRIAHALLGLLEPGVTFESDHVPGIAWEPVNAEAKARVADRFGKEAVAGRVGPIDTFDPMSTQASGSPAPNLEN